MACLTAAAAAQANYGSIQGNVRDKSGAVVRGANVEVTSVGTNEGRTVKTNAQGDYSVLSLQPVTYRVVVSASGFGTRTFDDVKVDTAKAATIDVVLTVGSTTQDVTVSAGAALLQTQDGTSSFTLEQKTIQQMPLNGRNTLSLALTLPGASGNAGSEYGTVTSNTLIPGRELIINGGRPGTSQFIADGQSVTSPGLGRTTVSFSPDTIQEFTVLESNFSAQYSQAGGAIIQQTTRAGNNAIHGTAYWFYRARHFQAVPFDNYLNQSAGDPHSPLQRSQFGIAAGGPVVIPKIYNGRNKTFFFASYEPTRQNVGNITPSLERVPTAAERTGDFCNSLVYKSNGTTTPYALLYNHFVKATNGSLLYAPNPAYNAAAGPSNGNPEYQYNFNSSIFDPNDSNSTCIGRRLVDASGASYVNPVSAKLVALYEQPNIPTVTSGSSAGANYSYFRRATSIDNRYSVRIDKTLPKGNTMFARVTIEPVFTNRFFRNVVTEPGTSDSSRAQQILVSETAVIRQNMTNDVRIGYSGGDFARNFPDNYQATDGTTPILGTTGTPNPLGYGLANFFNGASPNGGGAQFGGIGMNGIQNVSRDREHTYNASDDFTVTFGRHVLHLGVLAGLQQANESDVGGGYLAGGKFGFSNAVNNSEICTAGFNTISKGSPTKCVTDNSSGDPFAAFLEGVHTTQTFGDNIAPTYYYRWFSFGSYVQDDIRLRPNLTLNLGLRHQYQSPRWEKYNRQGQLNLTDNAINADNGLPAPIFQFAGYSGRSRYLDPAQYLDFEPRIGFSWSPYFGGAQDNIVIRGGYGLTHDVLTGRSRTPFPNLAENAFSGFRSYNVESGNDGSFNFTNVQGCGFASCQNNLPGQFGYNNTQWLPDPSLFNVPASGEISPVATNTPNGQDSRYTNTGVVFAPDFKTPYVQNFSLQIQTKLNATTALTVGWQGSKGTKLFSAPYDINNNPITQTIAYPGYDAGAGTNGSGGVIILEDQTHSGSIYHALLVNLEHRFSNGLQFNANYTFSKSLDDSSGGIEPDFSISGSQDSTAQTIQGNLPQPSYGTTRERSVSVFDTPHVFNSTAFYELPLGMGKKYLNKSRVLDLLVGGWQLTTLIHITTGQATYLTLGDSDRLNDFSSSTPYDPRPNIVPGVPLKNPDWSPSVANTVSYLNPRAFTFQGPGQFGNAPRMISGLRLPMSKQIDGSIFKSFHPFENKQRYIELRGEFFNLFNWRSFGINGVSTNLTKGNINQNAIGQANRYANLTPAVWDLALKGQCGSANPAKATGAVDSAATVCTELGGAFNSSFYILGQNSQNSIQPRLIQVAAKFYF